MGHVPVHLGRARIVADDLFAYLGLMVRIRGDDDDHREPGVFQREFRHRVPGVDHLAGHAVHLREAQGLVQPPLGGGLADEGVVGRLAFPLGVVDHRAAVEAAVEVSRDEAGLRVSRRQASPLVEQLLLVVGSVGVEDVEQREVAVLHPD
jgi:hypothetical protein